MAHKDQQTIDALVAVAKTMIGLWYTGEAKFTVGELSDILDRCSTIFQFYSPHEGTEVRLFALLELMRYYMVENNQ